MWVLGDRTQVLRNSPCKCFTSWLTSYRPSDSSTILTVGVCELFSLPQPCTGGDSSRSPLSPISWDAEHGRFPSWAYAQCLLLCPALGERQCAGLWTISSRNDTVEKVQWAGWSVVHWGALLWAAGGKTTLGEDTSSETCRRICQVQWKHTHTHTYAQRTFTRKPGSRWVGFGKWSMYNWVSTNRQKGAMRRLIKQGGDYPKRIARFYYSSPATLGGFQVSFISACRSPGLNLELLGYNPSERLSLAQVLKQPWVREYYRRILPPSVQMSSWALSVFTPMCFFRKLSSLGLLLHVVCLFSLLWSENK